jgi:hypothetical protein
MRRACIDARRMRAGRAGGLREHCRRACNALVSVSLPSAQVDEATRLRSGSIA